MECVTIGDKKAAVAVNIPLGTVELFPGANQDFKARHIRLSAASAVEPEVELDYDLTTGEVRKLFQPSVGGVALSTVVPLAGFDAPALIDDETIVVNGRRCAQYAAVRCQALCVPPRVCAQC